MNWIKRKNNLLILILFLLLNQSCKQTKEFSIEHYIEEEFSSDDYIGWEKVTFENIDILIPIYFNKDSLQNASLFFNFKTDSTNTNLFVNKLSEKQVNIDEYLSNFKSSFSVHEDLILLEEEIGFFNHKTHRNYFVTILYRHNKIPHMLRELIYYSNNKIYSVSINVSYLSRIKKPFDYNLVLYKKIISSLKIDGIRILGKTEDLENVQNKSIFDF